MKVAIVASPLIKTPPDKYGGIERITYWIGRKLLESEGEYEVHLFGKTGSYLEGATVYEYEGGEDDGFANLVKEADDSHNFDIIHDCTHDKILTKNHSHLSHKTLNSLQGMARRGPNTTAISEAQRKALGYSDRVPVVYHGVPIEEYPANIDKPGDYFLYMGSINDYKGVDIALDLCIRTGQKLKIAGICWETDYFDHLIRGRLDGDREFVGEVGGLEKLELLQNARALLHPVRWTEPGAIIVGEALACGTPVIGSDNGVIPELVSPAVGMICGVQHYDSYQKMSGGAYNTEEWVTAIENIDTISRDACAKYARITLTDERMVRQYLECYSKLLKGETWSE